MNNILEMKHIYKIFPGVIANADVCLEVRQGEVHTLLGENGAGKSTLMNSLCGLYKPTSGEILIEGKPVKFSSAKAAMAMGIGMVHQHFMLIPTLSVVENCMIGGKESKGLCIDIKSAAKRIADLAKQYNLNIDPYAKVADLVVGERQRVEIMKALYRGARILILDEPTAVLTPQETAELFNMIRSLTKSGFTVLFISHKLNEVKEISDRVTVLRLGRTMGTHNIEDCTVTDLARLMVGREINFTVERKEIGRQETVLSVQNLSLNRDSGSTKVLNGVSFDIHAGEIFGIAGVDGNGQCELVECLTGLRKGPMGKALYKNKDLLRCTTRQIMSSGVSHIPQDRQKSGLVMPMTLVENMMLQDYYKKEFGRFGFVNNKYINEYSERLIKEFGVKTPSRFELAQNLSGGNQQKVIIAREISRKPELLIAMHPTRGLDVGAIEYIHSQIILQRDNGIGVLLVSTELEEVLKLSDRVAVMYEGQIMGIVKPAETSIEEMGLMMGGMRLDQIRSGEYQTSRAEVLGGARAE
ncbi:MAG: ABC transporter ATP-binding protein [Candidatus Pelethousia sp.]|nr:ABC transporter ATP-binding protein [Candidatus Pelethousia sp.]